MKIISLNTWGARAGHSKFLDFFKQYRDKVDMFCLQETWHINQSDEVIKKHAEGLLEGAIVGGTVLKGMMTDLFPRVDDILTDYNGFFRPHYGNHYGLSMFIHKNVKLIKEDDVFVYKHREFIPTGDVGCHARNIQYATIQTPVGLRTVINFHGLWNGKGKTDTPDRLEQSDRIIEFIKQIPHSVIICGDFNLLPDTESLKKFEHRGLKNLIKELNITSTRTSFYKKPEKFADYMFAGQDVKVNEFKLLPEEVSDHLAMFLDFS